MAKKDMNYLLRRMPWDGQLQKAFADAVSDVAQRHNINVTPEDVNDFLADLPRPRPLPHDDDRAIPSVTLAIGEEDRNGNLQGDGTLENPIATSMALGEEDSAPKDKDDGMLSTMAMGEEGDYFISPDVIRKKLDENKKKKEEGTPSVTLAIGEEDPKGSGRATTLAVGEEGRNRPRPQQPDNDNKGDDRINRLTTMAIGEEDGGWPAPSTEAVGEEGRKPRPGITTAAVGEEGGKPTTEAVGEEDKKRHKPADPITTMALGEEGKKKPRTPKL